MRLANLLRDRRKLRFDEMLDRLEVSPATLKRDLKYLREQLGTPVAYDPFERSYQIAETSARSRQELPGMWFSEAEFYSLLVAHRLLTTIDPAGALATRMESVLQRAASLLSLGEFLELSQRIEFSIPGRRHVETRNFAAVTAALMRRRRLRLIYFTRSRDAQTTRDVSPLRLKFHRTWYLDAWCHQADALRRFSLDSLRSVSVLEEPGLDMSRQDIEHRMDGGYGAFAGEANHWAVLLFSKKSAQWVGLEIWHLLQRRRWLEDGRLELMIPYDDPTELVMDILRHGAEVEVVAGASLRVAVAEAAQAISKIYESTSALKG